MELLELRRSDTEAIMDLFKYRVEGIAQALSSGDEKVSVEDKVAELVTSVKSTMSNQGPTNVTFNPYSRFPFEVVDTALATSTCG